jgi:hypothetical protein
MELQDVSDGTRTSLPLTACRNREDYQAIDIALRSTPSSSPDPQEKGNASSRGQRRWGLAFGMRKFLGVPNPVFLSSQFLKARSPYGRRARQKLGKNYLGHKNRARNLDEITLLLPDVGTVEYRAPDIDLGSHPDISSGFGRKGWLRNTCLI